MMMTSSKKALLYFVIILLIVLDVMLLIWISRTLRNIDDLDNGESLACPSYYCPPFYDAQNRYYEGTPCVGNDGRAVAYRYLDKDKKDKVQCQDYTMAPNWIYPPPN